MHSRIYTGRVVHHRYAPRAHRFGYRLFMMYLDLDELPDLFEPYRLWSARKPAVAWFRRADHYGDPAQPLAEAVRELVFQRVSARPRGAIRLLTHLRYFGYCMNPVSFYYCRDRDDTATDFIVAEINNTPWGERWCYVLDCRPAAGRRPADGPADGRLRRHQFRFEKKFHVSPFMPMRQHYEWALSEPGERLGVTMRNRQDGERVFCARLALRRQALTAAALRGVLSRYPFMTARVVTAIYWQALRLWMKKTPFHAHPRAHPGPIPPIPGRHRDGKPTGEGGRR